MKKKIYILIILIVVIVLGSILFVKLDKNYKTNEVKTLSQEINAQKGSFEYVPPFENNSVEDVYYYSDDYFNQSGKEKNKHLRTMSMCLAISASTAIDKNDKAENVKALLQDIGFENIIIDDINKETSKDTIGSAIASKQIDGKTVIAVSIRGSNYLYEWASNFSVGKSGDLEGFSNASKTMIERLKKYQEEYQIQDCKIWIVGYSRGGAVSNLIGKYINENLDEFGVTEEDLYAYTFEAPLVSTSEVIYENIHNIVNPNDLINYVYPKKWGLFNNGVEERIGDIDKEISKKEWSIFSGELADSFDKEGNKKLITTEKFLQNFFDWLVKNNKLVDYAVSREKFEMYLEEPMTNLMEIYYQKTKMERQEILGFFQEVFSEFLTEENLNKIKEKFTDFSNIESGKQELWNTAKEYIDTAFETANIPLSKEELEIIEESISNISEVAVPILIVSIFDGSNTIEFDTKMSGFYHLATLVSNFPELIKEHYIQTNLKLVQAEDSYYKN